MSKTLRALTAFLAIAAGATAAHAGLVQTTRAGSAAHSGTADVQFESAASLGTIYSEGGLTFTRVGLTTDNNGCGFAGCPSSFRPANFVGNYFYGATTGAAGGHYIQIDADAGDLASIEFLFGWVGTQHGYYWEAFNDGALIGAGSGLANAGTVFGLSGASFDRLRFTSAQGTTALSSLSQGYSPAIDTVRFTAAAHSVPEPGSIALVGLGLLAAAGARRKLRG